MVSRVNSNFAQCRKTCPWRARVAASALSSTTVCMSTSHTQRCLRLPRRKTTSSEDHHLVDHLPARGWASSRAGQAHTSTHTVYRTRPHRSDGVCVGVCVYRCVCVCRHGWHPPGPGGLDRDTTPKDGFVQRILHHSHRTHWETHSVPFERIVLTIRRRVVVPIPISAVASATTHPSR